jgi:hypothetical protein
MNLRLAPLACAIGVALLVVSVSAGASQARWQRGTAMPLPRSEVAGAPFRGGIAVVGGFRSGGDASSRVDLYLPGRKKWRSLPDLPEVTNHAMAASAGGRIYVVGGYGDGLSVPRRTAYVFDGTRWTALARMPDGRAAGAAAIADGKLYVVGGISLGLGNRLAEDVLVLDLASGTWSTVTGPTPREHLAAVSVGGVVHALGGRLDSLDSNLDLFEAFSPGTQSWTTLAPVPSRRSGTGAAFAKGLIVSVGGEAPDGTIASVYGYDPALRSWRRLPNLPTPRHGLAVVAIKNRVFAVAGGPSPDLSVSRTNEILDLSR